MVVRDRYLLFGLLSLWERHNISSLVVASQPSAIRRAAHGRTDKLRLVDSFIFNSEAHWQTNKHRADFRCLSVATDQLLAGAAF